MESLQKKLEKDEDRQEKVNRLEFKMYLQKEVVQAGRDTEYGFQGGAADQPLCTPKENKRGEMSVYGTERVYNTIGHACVLVKKELEVYMTYANCKDDWNLAQKLMLHGCDPLPRRPQALSALLEKPQKSV